MRTAGVVVALMCAFAACGGSKNPGGFDTTPDQDAGADAGGGGGGQNDDSGGLVGAGCDNHCSSDNHSVLDCTNKVVQVCPDDADCLDGKCADACDRAQSDKNSVGCDYYTVDPDTIDEGIGACFAAFIANTTNQDVTITVERKGQSLDVSQFARIPSGTGQSLTYAPLPNGKLPPSQVAILFLAFQHSPLGAQFDVACPAGVNPAAGSEDPAVHGTARGDAFHIKTSLPVIAYDIFPYGGGAAAMTSATLLIPTSAWDTNYVGVNAYPASQKASFKHASPSLDIVGLEDGTKVTISPSADIVAGTNVFGASKGVPQTYTVNKGEILQFSQTDELSGSPIQSTKPIGVWGGATCLNIDVNTGYCDSAHQQIAPVKALGHEYVAVKYRNRDDKIEESVPFRMVGAVDGTVLTYDPAPPAGAPTSLATGQLVEFHSDQIFSVKSQDENHPFYVAAYMPGCGTYFTDDDCRGDPEFVNVVPPAQYLADYVFFTDPTYPETNLVVVRSKQNDGFHDVSLDCFGKLQLWQPLGSGGQYEYTRVDLSRHNFEAQAQCNNGRHEMKSDVPFGLTVWGWGSKDTGGAPRNPPGFPGFYTQCVSYAYPAGMSIKQINNVVVPPSPH
jgi:hypothetical protein